MKIFKKITVLVLFCTFCISMHAGLVNFKESKYVFSSRTWQNEAVADLFVTPEVLEKLGDVTMVIKEANSQEALTKSQYVNEKQVVVNVPNKSFDLGRVNVTQGSTKKTCWEITMSFTKSQGQIKLCLCLYDSSKEYENLQPTMELTGNIDDKTFAEGINVGLVRSSEKDDDDKLLKCFSFTLQKNNDKI